MIGCVVVEEMSDPLDADDKTCNLWLTAQHLLTYCDIMLLESIIQSSFDCISHRIKVIDVSFAIKTDSL